MNLNFLNQEYDREIIRADFYDKISYSTIILLSLYIGGLWIILENIVFLNNIFSGILITFVILFFITILKTVYFLKKVFFVNSKYKYKIITENDLDENYSKKDIKYIYAECTKRNKTINNIRSSNYYETRKSLFYNFIVILLIGIMFLIQKNILQ